MEVAQTPSVVTARIWVTLFVFSPDFRSQVTIESRIRCHFFGFQLPNDQSEKAN